MRRLSLALVALLVVATPALGDDIAKKRSIDAKIDSLQGRLAAKQRREHELRREVAGYTTRIRALESQVGDVSERLQTLDADLALHQHRLDALNALYALQTERYRFLRGQYRLAQQILDRRLVEIYESDQPSTLDVFLGARDVQAALDQVQYLSEIGLQDREVANEVARAKVDVRAARARTRAVRRTVVGETAVIATRTAQTRDVRNQLVGARNDLANTKHEKLADLSTLSADEQAEASEIDALQASSQALTERIRAAQSQRQSGSPSATPSSSGLIWPVSGPVTSPFGWRWGRMHEGIDIGVGYGTPIRAAAAGTVIYCGWESGYGNLTVIDHGGNLATAYGHQESIAVSCGQQVAQGDVIGYVGCTGHCFGPHLHFEVRINGSPVDPLGYL
jgi:murein DD-endopeptidase MepM/ murein hydrolase activator NlpD